MVHLMSLILGRLLLGTLAAQTMREAIALTDHIRELSRTASPVFPCYRHGKPGPCGSSIRECESFRGNDASM